MRLKKNPGPQPERGTYERYIDTTDPTIQGVLDEAKKYGATDAKDIHIKYDWGTIDFIIRLPEKVSEYIARLLAWERAVVEYNTWAEENKEAIEEELRVREARKQLKKLQKQKAIADQILELEKKLGEMK